MDFVSMLFLPIGYWTITFKYVLWLNSLLCVPFSLLFHYLFYYGFIFFVVTCVVLPELYVIYTWFICGAYHPMPIKYYLFGSHTTLLHPMDHSTSPHNGLDFCRVVLNLRDWDKLLVSGVTDFNLLLARLVFILYSELACNNSVIEKSSTSVFVRFLITDWCQVLWWVLVYSLIPFYVADHTQKYLSLWG